MQDVNLQLQQGGTEDHQGREQRPTQGPAQGARSQETGSVSGSCFKGWAQVFALEPVLWSEVGSLLTPTSPLPT